MEMKMKIVLLYSIPIPRGVQFYKEREHHNQNPLSKAQSLYRKRCVNKFFPHVSGNLDHVLIYIFV